MNNFPVCYNPQCVNHQYTVKDYHEKYVRIDLPVSVGDLRFEQKLINRYPYCNGAYRGQVDFYLCDVCHNACEMLGKKS